MVFFWVHVSPVSVCGQSGAVVDDVGRIIVKINNCQFSVVCLVCGSNDLCHWRHPENVTDNLLSLSRLMLRFKGVQRVVICQILRRTMSNHHFTVSLEVFNEHVRQVNRLLASKCPETAGVVCWRHNHRVQRTICADGTHLTSQGVKHFHDSVYRSLWSQLQIVLGLSW